MRPETALLIAVGAAVVGQLLGGALTLFGGWVNDHFASKRQERQQQREDSIRIAQQEREDQLRLRDARLRAYKAFVSAASIDGPLSEHDRFHAHRALNEAYLETTFYAGGLLQNYADDLYEAARTAIDQDSAADLSWSRLAKERHDFTRNAVRGERPRDGYATTRRTDSTEHSP